MTNATGVSLYIAPDVMDEAQEAGSFNLKVPAHAKLKGAPGTPKFQATWNELVDITNASIEAVETEEEAKKGRIAVRVKMQVAADSTDATNVGRPVNQSFLINPAKLKEQGHSEQKMSSISLGKLKSLLRACGVDVAAGTGVDLGEYFSAPEGEVPAVVGAKIYVTMRHREGNDYPQDVLAFVNPAEGTE